MVHIPGMGEVQMMHLGGPTDNSELLAKTASCLIENVMYMKGAALKETAALHLTTEEDVAYKAALIFVTRMLTEDKEDDTD
jgi:hypothetical protein